MALPKIPQSRQISRIFGALEDMEKSDNWVFLEFENPNLYALVDKEEKILYTNVVTNDEGEVVTTNWTEKYNNFVLNENGEVTLGTKLAICEDTGIQLAWYRMPTKPKENVNVPTP